MSIQYTEYIILIIIIITIIIIIDHYIMYTQI